MTRVIPRHDGFLRLCYLPNVTVSEQSAVIGPVVILLFFTDALQPLTDLVLYDGAGFAANVRTAWYPTVCVVSLASACVGSHLYAFQSRELASRGSPGEYVDARPFHRRVAIAFTVTDIADLIVQPSGTPPPWVSDLLAATSLALLSCSSVYIVRAAKMSLVGAAGGEHEKISHR